jgi:PKD repeat protein
LALLGLCSVAAALEVSVTSPPNPFIGYTGETLGFSGGALDDSGADVTDRCRWTWYFSDGATTKGNPVVHAFLKAGHYTVTAAAEMGGHSDAATIEGDITDPPRGPLTGGDPAIIYVVIHSTLTPLDGVVCDDCLVYVEVVQPRQLTAMHRKQHNEQQWHSASYSPCGQSQHDGKTWNVYASAWLTWEDKN